MSASAPPYPLDAVTRISAVPTILRLITQLTGLRLSLVAEVTDQRWLCCAVNDQLGFGLAPGGELAIETTLCKEVRDAHKAIWFSDATSDPQYALHPTPKLYKFKSYISVPIYKRDRSYFGNLCALDAEVRELSPKILSMFEIFAELIGMQLDNEAAHWETTLQLVDEKQTGVSREQFIAMVGHDLRSPLAAITTGLEVLGLTHADASTQRVLERIKNSAQRMVGLVDEMMDFARGRLGSGVQLVLTEVTTLDTELLSIASELRAATPGAIEVTGSVGGAVHCDLVRVVQAVTNLVSNAISHGTPGGTVRVAARRGPTSVSISVSSEGAPIPAEKLASIFEPYSQGSSDKPQKGLGLGLYIVSEVARGHGGTVNCVSTNDGTTFTLVLPIGQDTPLSV